MYNNLSFVVALISGRADEEKKKKDLNKYKVYSILWSLYTVYTIKHALKVFSAQAEFFSHL